MSIAWGLGALLLQRLEISQGENENDEEEEGLLGRLTGIRPRTEETKLTKHACVL